MSRPLGVAASLGLAAAVLAVPFAAVAPASAAPSNNVLVSLDGNSWTTDLAALFDGAALVPGGAYSRTILVRNDSAVAATLAVTAADAEATSNEYLNALSLSAATQQGAAEAISLADATDCAPLTGGTVLAAGQTVPLTLDLGLAQSADGRSQNQSAGLTVRISLTEVSSAPPTSMCPGAPAPSDGAPLDLATPLPGEDQITGSGTGATNSATAAALGTSATTAAPADSGATAAVSSPTDSAPAVSDGEQLGTLAIPGDAATGTSDALPGVFVLLFAAAAGLIWYVVARRRRREAEE